MEPRHAGEASIRIESGVKAVCSVDVDKDTARIRQQQGHAWKLQVRKLELIN